MNAKLSKIRGWITTYIGFLQWSLGLGHGETLDSVLPQIPHRWNSNSQIRKKMYGLLACALLIMGLAVVSLVPGVFASTELLIDNNANASGNGQAAPTGQTFTISSTVWIQYIDVLFHTYGAPKTLSMNVSTTTNHLPVTQLAINTSVYNIASGAHEWCRFTFSPFKVTPAEYSYTIYITDYVNYKYNASNTYPYGGPLTWQSPGWAWWYEYDWAFRVYGSYTDPVPPSFSGSLTSNTTKVGQNVLLNGLTVTDNEAVSGYIASWNNSGPWQNFTWKFASSVSFSGQWNFTKGNVVSAKIYANDTANNWAVSTQYNFTLLGLTATVYFGSGGKLQVNATSIFNATVYSNLNYGDKLVLDASTLGTYTFSYFAVSSPAQNVTEAYALITISNDCSINAVFEAGAAGGGTSQTVGAAVILGIFAMLGMVIILAIAMKKRH